MKKPTVSYPTLTRGYIEGPIRCESLDGSELWLPPATGRLKIPPFWQVDPNDRVLKQWCVSHLQKRSHYFSLLYDPFIFHHWVGEPQKTDANGNWIPGSEKGNLLLGGYWRTPGFRWQKPDSVSNWTPWVFSGGRIPGTHFD